ncbi:uncharacterized protein NPIL_541671 [Nephila pilipes]|uniref:Uncharacterized protein n=1 Tax=Nephila pilipes TaxID=299642 RepID=A0A8X6Q7A3_NEPPI|nr:uncharacterized protein NPIL_541671 [Nephila pilipes]
MTTCTLFKLADMALITPERGAVNFNILHLLLQKILKETGIGNRRVKYKAPDRDSFMKKILEGEEISSSDADAEELDISSEDSLEEKDSLELKDSLEIKDTPSQTDTEDTGSEIWSISEPDLFNTVNNLGKKLKMVIRRMEELEMKLTRKITPMKLKRKIAPMKVTGKITEINDDEDQKDFLDQKEQRVYSDLDRDEFEEAMEEIGEAIALLGNKLKKKEESQGESINQENLKKLCVKAAEEEIAKRQGVFSQGLQHLAIAVRNLQDIIKKIIYPDAAGITK